MGSVRNIKKRIDAERKLKESEKKYRQLVETTGDIIVTHDHKGVITFVNQAGLDFSGFSRKEVVGTKIVKLLPQNEIPEFLERRRKRRIGDKKHYNYETSFINKYGDIINVEIHATPMRRNGEYKGSLIVARDITQRKKSQKEKQTRKEQSCQSQRLETLGTLAGGIGHDFNNILTPILGYAEMVQENLNKNNPSYKFMEEIIKGCLRAKDIIAQMLSFSRDAEHKKQKINLVPIVKETMKLLRPSIPRTIDIQQKITSSCLSIKADATQLHQVIMNLCTNAYQAMKSSGGNLSINLTQTTIDRETSNKNIDLQEGQYVKLIISDTGSGMDRETLKHIFEPYYTTKKEGTGMGLAVVHGIVKSHNGTINVTSKKGEGTTFTLFFPLVQSQESEYEREEINNSVKKGNQSILLVDDRKDVAQVLASLLRRMGYQVKVVNSSVEALQLYQKDSDKFDVLLTDYSMPEMDGLELSHKLSDFDKKLPIIMMSGHSGSIKHETLKAAGVKEVINKPIKANQITEVIQSLLQT